MKKNLSILFILPLLITACAALAEETTSDAVPTKLTDLGIVFGLPADMSPTEKNATITEEGVPYFAFISEDGRLIVEFYGSNFKDLSEAEAWFTAHVSDQLTRHDVEINGMRAIEYTYTNTSDEGVTTYADAVFALNDSEEVFEFWESTFDEDRSGKLASELYPLSYFSEVDTSGSEGGTASDGTATGICTADKVNLRVEPNANANYVAQINRGEKLVLLETEGEWTKVSCSKGEGYIKTQYIDIQ
ncbi:MAG: SH3 domain-containing protein [Clostridia bacterium]|nr:SH3 domain-containing protein [Clostridia bacterium]